MRERLGTAEDLAKLPAVIIGVGPSPNPNAAGLVRFGGIYMTEEGLVKMRAWKRTQQEEK